MSNETAILYLSTAERAWLPLTTFPFQDRSLFSVAYLQDCIYVSGGEELETPMKFVYR